MGYFGKVSTITGTTATVILLSNNIVSGQLNIPEHIFELTVGDFVLCVFTSNDFQQGVIISKTGDLYMQLIGKIDEINDTVDEVNNKIGETTDDASDKSVLGYNNSIYQHIHKPAKCYPTLANGITIAGSATAWTLGNFVEVVPVNAIAVMYDIHWINFESASANDVYELVLYSGLVGAEIEIGRIRTFRQSVTSGANNVPIQIPALMPNTRISAKLASSSGGDNVTISVFYHEYD